MMKKYPFSKKAMKTILAASIAFTPMTTISMALPGNAAAAGETVNDQIDQLASRFYQFYAYADNDFNEVQNKIQSAAFEEKILSEAKSLGFDVKGDATKEQAFVNLLKATANVIYTPYGSKEELAAAIKNFRTANAADFNVLFDETGTVTADEFVQFLLAMEPNLERSIINNLGEEYSTVIKEAVAATLQSGNFNDLKGKLSNIGLSVEELFILQDRLNNRFLDPNTSARSALMTSAFTAKKAVISLEGRTLKLTIPVAGLGNIEIAEAFEWKVNGRKLDGVTIPDNFKGNVKVSAHLKDGIQVAEATVNVGGGSSGGGGGGNGGNNGNPKPPQVENGTVTVSTDAISSNPEQIVKAIEDAKDFKVLEITLSNQKEDVVIPAVILKAMMDKNEDSIIRVTSNKGSFSLPIKEIDLEALANELGGNPEDVQIVITVAAGKDKDKVIEKHKLKVVSPIVAFKVEANVNGKVKELKDYQQFVNREVKGESKFKADQSVGVRLNEDGTFTALPTYFTDQTAVIKSHTNSEYVIVENDKTFKDVPESHWNQASIEKMANKYIVNGYPDGTFKSEAATSRIQLTVMLVRALGLPTDTEYNGQFKDVKGNEWFVPELTAAMEAGIIKGTENGRFAPNDKISRAQMAAMIHRALQFVKYDPAKLDTQKSIDDYTDAHHISDWAREDIEVLLQAGIMTGKTDGSCDPLAPTTRAQMVKVLDETLKFIEFIN